MQAPRPQRYACYFMISPDPNECPQGLIDKNVDPNPPTGGWGPMFYIKFGDGTWHNNRYTTHNPSFMPAHTDEAVNIPGVHQFYNFPNPMGGVSVVNPGTFLERSVLVRSGFARHNGGEWFRVHAGPGSAGIAQLVKDLKDISAMLDDETIDFGYKKAEGAWSLGRPLSEQRHLATREMQKVADEMLKILRRGRYN